MSSIEQKIAQMLAEGQQDDQVDDELLDEELEDLDEDVDDLDEETDIGDPSKGGEPNPDSARNNVNKQEIGGKSKTRNVVNKDESEQEASHIAGIKEDVAALVDGEGLTEEFKAKAETIFEAAVLSRVKQEVARLDEAYEERLAEQVEEIKEGLVEKVDGYLDYVVEQWVARNEIALERGLRTEILEGFVGKLKEAFEESYIEVPEEKFDVLGALEEETEVLADRLNEQLAINVELNSKLSEYAKSEIVEMCSDGLADTDREKLEALAEELVFEDAESFEKKVQTIRESYFAKSATSKMIVESPITDAPVLTEENVKYVAPGMRGYVAALSKI